MSRRRPDDGPVGSGRTVPPPTLPRSQRPATSARATTGVPSSAISRAAVANTRAAPAADPDPSDECAEPDANADTGTAGRDSLGCGWATGPARDAFSCRSTSAGVATADLRCAATASGPRSAPVSATRTGGGADRDSSPALLCGLPPGRATTTPGRASPPPPPPIPIAAHILRCTGSEKCLASSHPSTTRRTLSDEFRSPTGHDSTQAVTTSSIVASKHL